MEAFDFDRNAKNFRAREVVPENGFFENIKTSFPRIYKKMRIWKVRGRGLPGRQNTPTPRGSIFKLSRGSQLPYSKKKKC